MPTNIAMSAIDATQVLSLVYIDAEDLLWAYSQDSVGVWNDKASVPLPAGATGVGVQGLDNILFLLAQAPDPNNPVGTVGQLFFALPDSTQPSGWGGFTAVPPVPPAIYGGGAIVSLNIIDFSAAVNGDGVYLVSFAGSTGALGSTATPIYAQIGSVVGGLWNSLFPPTNLPGQPQQPSVNSDLPLQGGQSLVAAGFATNGNPVVMAALGTETTPPILMAWYATHPLFYQWQQAAPPPLGFDLSGPPPFDPNGPPPQPITSATAITLTKGNAPGGGAALWAIALTNGVANFGMLGPSAIPPPITGVFGLPIALFDSAGDGSTWTLTNSQDDLPSGTFPYWEAGYVVNVATGFQANSENLQVALLGGWNGQIPLLVWQDGTGDWQYYFLNDSGNDFDPLPFFPNDGAGYATQAVGMSFGQSLQIGYLGSDGKIYINYQDAAGNWDGYFGLDGNGLP